MSNDIIVYDKPRNGKALCLPESARVGGGGEGVVYAVNRPGDGKKIAVKVFSEKTLNENEKRDSLSRKIAAMVEIGKRDNCALINFPMAAWPQLSVYGEDGAFVGYGMRLAEGKTLLRLAHPMLYKEHFPGMDREKVADMLFRLWESAQFLHARDICIGDVNLTNFLCNDRYEGCWIDADSFQVGGFPCPVGRPEMTPPEHLDKNYEDIVRTPRSDLFSLAILTFQCLMLGRHPYDHIGGEGNSVDNLRKGHFPYTTGNAPPGKQGAVPTGPWYRMWSHYTFKIKKLFARAFKEGAGDPLKRPSSGEWMSTLKEYVGVLRSPTAYGKHSRDMKPAEEKQKGLPHRGAQQKS